MNFPYIRNRNKRIFIGSLFIRFIYIIIITLTCHLHKAVSLEEKIKWYSTQAYWYKWRSDIEKQSILFILSIFSLFPDNIAVIHGSCRYKTTFLNINRMHGLNKCGFVWILEYIFLLFIQRILPQFNASYTWNCFRRVVIVKLMSEHNENKTSTKKTKSQKTNDKKIFSDNLNACIM